MKKFVITVWCLISCYVGYPLFFCAEIPFSLNLISTKKSHSQKNGRIIPKFSDLKTSNKTLSTSDIQDIEKTLCKIITEQDYNRVTSKSYLAQLVQENENFSFAQWTQNKNWREISQAEGGDCINASQKLLQLLPKTMHPQIIASVLPLRYQQKNGPLISHVAVLIKYYEDDSLPTYVLMDPGFDVCKPIVLNKKKNSIIVATSKGLWSFELQENCIQCCADHFGTIKETGKPDRIIYYLKGFQNYEDHIEQALIFADVTPSIVKKDKYGNKLAHIKIDLKKRCLFWTLKEESFEESFDALMYYGFPQEFDKLLPHFERNFDTIKAQISVIVRNGNKLLSLSENTW